MELNVSSKEERRCSKSCESVQERLHKLGVVGCLIDWWVDVDVDVETAVEGSLKAIEVTGWVGLSEASRFI